jgi:pilus assembly protein Flp/PilA
MLKVALDLRSGMLRAFREEQGQGLAEYALILAFIAVVCIAALTLLGVSITSILNSITTQL